MSATPCQRPSSIPRGAPIGSVPWVVARTAWAALGLIVLIGLTIQATGAFAQPVEAFFDRSAAAMRVVDAAAPGAPLHAACTSQVEASFDLPVLARAVAGPEIWASFGETRQPVFIAALRARLAAECVRSRRGGTLTPLSTRMTAAGASMTVRLTLPDGAERVLVWRLKAGGPWGWQASDLIADGFSLTTALSDEVRGAFDALGGNAAIAALARGASLR